MTRGKDLPKPWPWLITAITRWTPALSASSIPTAGRMQLNDGRVIPNFMKQALRGEDLTVYGDGSQTRSFCYVSDEIEGFLRLSHATEHLPVNLGNPTEFTILECARHVLAVTASKSKIRYEALPQDDPQQRCPDITKARTLLGWEPKTDLETGLRLSLDYFRKAAQI